MGYPSTAAAKRPAPLVSVVIPNYNYGAYLGAAIDSALGQTLQDLEVIVVDDASTDDSLRVIETFGDRITAIRQSSNQGQIAAYNTGFAAAQGRFIVFLDSDDRLHPQALAEVVQAFGPGVSKVHFRARLVDASGQSLEATIPKQLVAGDMSALLLDKSILYPSPPGSANAYRAESLRTLMPIPLSHERHGADFFTIYGAALLGAVGVAGQGRPLLDYRVHSEAHRSGLKFGNAAQSYDEADRLRERNTTFAQWLSAHPSIGRRIPTHLTEFSIEKNRFSQKIFSEKKYWPGVHLGARHLRSMLRCIWYRPSNLLEKLALCAITLSILFLPRRWGWPLARYLCNPASRGL